jgi:hypothetical protein
VVDLLEHVECAPAQLAGAARVSERLSGVGEVGEGVGLPVSILRLSEQRTGATEARVRVQILIELMMRTAQGVPRGASPCWLPTFWFNRTASPQYTTAFSCSPSSA